jgi:hypothetical protein
MKLIWALVVSTAFLCGASNLAAKSEAADSGYYTAKDSEFYLTPEQLLFIRPGLVLEIVDVVIPADRKTEVTFKLSDPAGLPLDRSGVFTPGPVSTSFILAYIPAGEEAYVSYNTRVQTSPITGDSAVQASTDSGGSYTELSVGTYKYKFRTVLPEGYDMDVTHTLGMYASRNLAEFELSTYYANELEHFVPSGSSMPMPRDIVTTETCNNRCHQGLALHGGSRREIGLCVLCHNPSQGIDPDTGNTVDMPVMTHKIHMGAGLANGYNIIGYNQTNHDYSDVVFPADVNECEACHTGGIPTANFPLVATPTAVPVCDMSSVGTTKLNWGDLDAFEIHIGSASGPLFVATEGEGSTTTGKWVSDGTVFVLVDKATGNTIQTLPVNASVLGCIANPPGAFVGMAATDHTNWLDNPSRVACGACHDWVDFATGEGHSDGKIVQENDSKCALCHKPFVAEFDRSVRGAHMPLYKSAQLPGIIVDFKEVTNTNPGEKPTVTFSASTKNGTLDPYTMDRFRLMLSGPNDDISFRVQDSSAGKSVVWVGDNLWSYTFSTALPADATGSYAVSFEGRANVEVMMGGDATVQRDVGENPSLAFAVGSGTTKARRQVVDDAKCEACHVNLAFHGGGRHDPDYCVTCHMPSAVTTRGEPQTYHFKYMIHSIHRGAELENGYVIGSDDFSDIEFTGDLRNCDACHVNNSQQLSGLPAGLLPTITPQAWWSPMDPQAAACLSCHDDDDTAAHAYSNTNFVGEACTTCHGEGKSASVDMVHAH